MRINFVCRIISLAVLLLSLNCIAQAQEERIIPSVSTEDYKQVIDMLFPLDALKNIDWEFVTILRYLPSFEAESQIVMIGRKGYVQVIEYKSLDGNMYYKLHDVPGIEDMKPADMIKHVRVGKRELRLTFPQAQLWRRNLLASVNAYMRPATLNYVPPSSELTVMMDGTTYELWDVSWNWELHFELHGGSSHKGAPPLNAAFIKCMNIARQEVAKRK